MLTSLPNAIVLAFVTFAVSLSLAKVFGKKFGYSIDSNQVSFATFCDDVGLLNLLVLTCTIIPISIHVYLKLVIP